MNILLENTWIIIPAFNEASVIGNVVSNVRKQYPNVVVVDDCSTDETAEVSLAAGATILRHIINLGQGAAIQTGIDFALEKKADVCITFDADGQHCVDDIAKLLDIHKRTNCDVVLGSRFLGSTKGMSFQRKLLLGMAVKFMSLTSGLSLSDAHNGFRLFSRNAMKHINITQNRMAHASEIISQIIKSKLTVKEAPVTIVYTEYSIAKGQRATASFRILAELLAARLMR